MVHVPPDGVVVIEVNNRFTFRPLSDLECSWSVTSGRSHQDLIRSESTRSIPDDNKLRVSLNAIDFEAMDCELWFNVQCGLKDGGGEIAHEQFKIVGPVTQGGRKTPRRPLPSGTGRLSVKENKRMVEVWLGDGSEEARRIGTVDRLDGALSSYTTPCGFEAIPLT